MAPTTTSALQVEYNALSLDFLAPTQMYNKAAALNESTSNAAVPWLQGFVDTVGLERARYLLRDVGVVEAVSDDMVAAPVAM